MEQLFAQIKEFPFKSNGSRTNIRPKEETVQYGKSRYLAHAHRVFSNTRHDGPILEATNMLGEENNFITKGEWLCITLTAKQKQTGA